MSKEFREFSEGMSAIERAITKLIHSKVSVDSLADYSWSLIPTEASIPDAIDLDVKWTGKDVRLRFSRQQVEDAWDGVTDAFTKAMIQEAFHRLTR